MMRAPYAIRASAAWVGAFDKRSVVMGRERTFLHSDMTAGESPGWDRKMSISITGRVVVDMMAKKFAELSSHGSAPEAHMEARKPEIEVAPTEHRQRR